MGSVTAGLAVGDMEGPGDRPLWAKCVKCSHCWPVAYLPMDMRTFARVTKKISCPRCGDPKPVVAKQDNGILKEQADAA
jgi:Zn finger protein HypA/HybF involved in hydrogenase expression